MIIVNLGQTQREINFYSSKLIFKKKNVEDKTLKRTLITNIKCFRPDQSSVWTKKQPRMGN